MTNLENKITNRVAELEKEMADFIANANQTVAAYQASIGELKSLLVEKVPETK